jgi:hypothetical protein
MDNKRGINWDKIIFTIIGFDLLKWRVLLFG